MSAHFVDENFRILAGDEAAAAIRERSDAKYLEPSGGILKVPLERWKIAQAFERRGWMQEWRGATEADNTKHAENFNGYAALCGQQFDRAIELGCGPFTNLWVMLHLEKVANPPMVRHVELLDPLIREYQKLPNCRFTELKDVHDCAIEEMPIPAEKFDLVVMINVLEHCFDAERVLQKVLDISAPGAVFVFAEHIYDSDEIRRVVPDRYYEAGHPLMAPYDRLGDFTSQHFEQMFVDFIDGPKVQVESCPHWGSFYFIGRKT